MITYEQYQEVLKTEKEHFIPSGCICLLFKKEGEIFALLTQRPAKGISHAGNVVFPGGRKSQQDRSLKTTACRETKEEIGISGLHYEIIGDPEIIRTSTEKIRAKKTETRLWEMHIFTGVCSGNTLEKIKTNEKEVSQIKLLPLRELFVAMESFLGDSKADMFPQIKVSKCKKQVPIQKLEVEHYRISIVDNNGHWEINNGTAYFLIELIKKFQRYAALEEFIKKNRNQKIKGKKIITLLLKTIYKIFSL